MKRSEIIEKTLKEMRSPQPESQMPNSEQLDYEATVIAEHQAKLPDEDIKTCADFKHLNVECCDSCHSCCPEYDMKLIDLPDGSKAWVCDTVEWAIHPERRQQFEEWSFNSPAAKMLREIFGDDDPSTEQK